MPPELAPAPAPATRIFISGPGYRFKYGASLSASASAASPKSVTISFYLFQHCDERLRQDHEKGRSVKDIYNLPENVRNFRISGYQVCHKWLYDSKKAGRTLTNQDITHYHKFIAALNKTIKLIKRIDEVIGGHGRWPVQ